MNEGKITNNKKIISGIDSVVYALAKGAKSVMILSHLGRPKGIKNMKYSLTPVAVELNSVLKQVHKDPHSLGKYSQVFKIFAANPAPNVRFLSDCVGSEIREVCDNPEPGSIFLFENLKFHLEEEGIGMDTSGNKIYSTIQEDNTFRESLRSLGDVFVNDAFSLSHHAYSSMLGTAFDSKAAGLLLSKEIKHLSKLIKKPDRPFLAILGGTKIIEKFHLIDNLQDKVSDMIIAGAMAFPFLRRLHRMHTGHSIYDVEGSKVVKTLMKKARKNKVTMHFPVDFLSGSKLGAVRLESVKSGIEDEWMGLDIGPESCVNFERVISRSKTILWMGPPGAYELDHFQAGTQCMLFDIVKATLSGAMSVLVGEDTANCAARWGQTENVTHVSTGSEAAADMLKGKVLPGVAALSDFSYDIKVNLKLNL
ncbi:phosphoglycerate kinase-like [Macrosteles quadrilineatus]|uniref:phosphoglycerate kinase-like n=1 Tax=Macrosteles quadrilineatus TaxID=74068 RepID=UPI0023E2A170|nr:phosphoglycerate kinase-like [Macrosteles quadrilineatus]